MRLLCTIVLAAVSACGGAAPGANAQPGLQSGGKPAQKTPDQAVGPRTAEQPPSADDRCNKLVEHVVTLAVAERPAEQTLNDAERKNLESQLRTSWGTKCTAITDRGYRCALAAPTLSDLDRCGG